MLPTSLYYHSRPYKVFLSSLSFVSMVEGYGGVEVGGEGGPYLLHLLRISQQWKIGLKVVLHLHLLGSLGA